MPSKLSLTGSVFGKLTVLSDTGKRHKNGGVIWGCSCSCGGTAQVRADSLKSGHTVSCGCVQVESVVKLKTTHGLSKSAGEVTPTFASWNSMIARVRDTRPEVAKYYLDKGITVCERWQWYPNFLEDMGEKPEGKTIDRIDGTKGYCKENCRWASDWQQGQHRANSQVSYLLFPEILAKRQQGLKIKEIAEMYDVPYSTMRAVFNRGIPNWQAAVVRGDVDAP